MLARRGVDFRNRPQTRPNLPTTTRRTVVIARASTSVAENELVDESSQLRPSEKKEPATLVASGGRARAAGDRAKAIPNDREDRQSAELRWRSQRRGHAQAASTRPHTRTVRRP